MKTKAVLRDEVKEGFLLEVHHRLSDVYGRGIRYFHNLDPMSELVSALLSHRTRNGQSAAAFHELRRRFPTWEEVMNAPLPEVEAAIAACTWPEQKAPRIQQILGMILDKRGALSLEFLREMEVAAARDWLEALPGVGPKTSAAVISFSDMRGKALPVDSHHFRVVTRLGIIDPKVGEAKSHRILEGMLPEAFSAQEMYDHHQVVMKHGKAICLYQKPLCRECVLLDLCPTGQALVNS